MNDERRIEAGGFCLGDLVEALYDEVIDLPLSGPARESMVIIMLGDLMRREGRTILLLARPPRPFRRVAA